MIDFDHLSAYLRETRKERHLSMGKASAIVGITEDALGKFERGECHIKLENIMKLLDAYELPVSVLNKFYVRSERMQVEIDILQKH